MYYNKKIIKIDRKQEVPHDGAMCDLMWSDPDGIKINRVYEGMEYEPQRGRLYIWVGCCGLI
jgi:diadenosine tetraphosphatase ApaH/serine/threonine PP2A family protein phosphatase